MPSKVNMSNVLSVLVEFEGQPVSTLQVAKWMELSWKTARDNLEALFNLGLVERGRVGNNKRIFWRSSTKKLESINFNSEEYRKKEKKLYRLDK